MTLVLLAYLEWSSKHRCTPANLMAPSVKAVGSSFPCWTWAKCVGLLNMPIIFINGEYESWWKKHWSLVYVNVLVCWVDIQLQISRESREWKLVRRTILFPKPEQPWIMLKVIIFHQHHSLKCQCNLCGKKNSPKTCFLLLMEIRGYTINWLAGFKSINRS